MGSIDGEIPAVWFLISSIGFVILTFIQYRNTGKSFNTIFLSVMAIIFFCKLHNFNNSTLKIDEGNKISIKSLEIP